MGAGLSFSYRTWAQSWGNSWGDSWGVGVTATQPGGGTSKRDKRKRKKPRYYSDDQPLIPVKPEVLVEIEARAAEATRAEMARRLTEQTDDDALAISLIMAALK